MNTRQKTLRFVAVLCAALLFAAGCKDLLVPEPPQSDPLRDFEAAWGAVKSVYPFFVFKRIDWDSLYTVYRPKAEHARGDEIVGVLFSMLAELRDGHVSIVTPGGSYLSTYEPPRHKRDKDRYSPFAVRKYFDRELRLAGNGSVAYEVIAGNIGYINVATLTKENPVLEGFDQALSFVRETRALIIDVRANGGGTDNNSVGIVGRLIAEPIDNLPYPLSDGTMHQGYPISLRGSFQYLEPVVLLINGTCFSATEDFVEMMKHVPTVTAVGDTTSGGSGAPNTYTLPSGMKINVSTKAIPRYDGQPIEWNGVPPDIRVVNTPEEVRDGVDRQLETALAILSKFRPPD